MILMFKTFLRTFTDKNFYEEVLGRGVRSALKDYFRFSAVVSFLIFIFIAVAAVVPGVVFVREMSQKITAAYPDDLVLSVSKGQIVQTGGVEPIYIPIDANGKMGEEFRTKGIENFAVIDTNAPASEEVFRGYKTLVLVTKTSILNFDNGTSTIAITSSSKFPDFTFDKDKLKRFLGYASYAPYSLPFLFLLVAALSLIFFAAYLLVIALVFFLISKLTKSFYTFKQSYAIVLYAAMLPIVISWFLGGNTLIIIGMLTLLIALLRAKPSVSVQV